MTPAEAARYARRLVRALLRARVVAPWELATFGLLRNAPERHS